MVKTNKGVKILVVALLLTLTMFCFIALSMNVGQAVSNDSDNLEYYAATSYNFENGAVSENSHETYTIGSLNALKNFAYSINKNRVTFLGSTIKLTSNIDCQDEEIVLGYTGAANYEWDVGFKGVFDGQGRTILNNNMKQNYGLSLNDQFGGFFSRNEGVIKNTLFQNFKLRIEANDGAHVGSKHYCGVIASFNSGIIQNCIIRDVHIISDNYKSNAYVAAIAYKNNYTIKDCLIDGTFTVESDDKNFIANADGAHVYSLVGDNRGDVENCVFAASYSEIGANTSHIEEDLSVSNFTFCYNTNRGDGFMYLNSISSEGGPNIDAIWYYNDKYNSSWPCLRSFMNWRKIVFSSAVEDPAAENGEYTISTVGGRVDKSEIYIPADASYGSGNISNNKVTILGDTVTATQNLGYSFVKWEYGGATYVAIFTNAKYKITFGLAVGEEFLTINGETEDIQYEVSAGTTLTFTFKDEFIKKEDGFITFKTCEIEIYKEGEIDETITYQIKDSKHYISEKAINEKIKLENKIFEVTNNTTLRVVKSNSMEYNATFE